MGGGWGRGGKSRLPDRQTETERSRQAHRKTDKPTPDERTVRQKQRGQKAGILTKEVVGFILDVSLYQPDSRP